MTDFARPDRPELRLSDAEREQAVAALAEAQLAGRLTAVEYGDRATAARAAVTRGDLVPLFTDLPAETRAPSAPAASATGSAAYASPAASQASFVDPDLDPRSGADGSGRDGTGGALGGRVGATIMALVPFIALLLFFLTGFAGGWAWSWVWFLLVPIAGIVIYGPGSDERRRRRR